MPRHSHGDKRFEAQKVFTDREKPMERFLKAVSAPQTREEYRVLTWYGVGGQGKSRLCREMQARLQAKGGIALGSLNFDDPAHRRLEDAMLKLRGDLRKSGSIHFPTFDLAFARLFALQRPGARIREAYPELFRKGESEVLDDLIDLAEGPLAVVAEGTALVIPGANLVYKYGARFGGRLLEWWSSQAVKTRLAELDALTAPELANQLPKCLGFDLWRAQAAENAPRIVLMIDAHEKLWGGEGAQGVGESLRTDAWLRALADEAPGALVAIFGRDRLRWGEIDPE